MDRIKRLSYDVLDKHKSKFGESFSDNKKILGEVSIIRSKGLKNEIAGYITKFIKKEIRERKTKQAQIDAAHANELAELAAKAAKLEAAAAEQAVSEPVVEQEPAAAEQAVSEPVVEQEPAAAEQAVSEPVVEQEPAAAEQAVSEPVVEQAVTEPVQTDSKPPENVSGTDEEPAKTE